MQLSVIICTHNPRFDYLSRVLQSLATQTLPRAAWELLVIDNGSSPPLDLHQSLAWHANKRCISEELLGLTPARIRGIKEAVGELLVFVDDDNILSNDYLATACMLSKKHPFLGAIGGQILPEYEQPLPDWLALHERIFAIRRADRPRWSNIIDDWRSQPWGAGMVLKAEVCRKYVDQLNSDPARQKLDRRGNSLISGGDTDMVLTSIDLGMGFGVFPELVVHHLISANRMEKKYVLQLIRGLTASNYWINYLRNQPLPRNEPQSVYAHLRGLWHFLKRPSIEREIDSAICAGQEDFFSLIANEELPRLRAFGAE